MSISGSTVLLTVFIVLGGWGVVDVSRMNLCSGAIACSETWSALALAFGAAAVGAIVTILWSWAFRRRLDQRSALSFRRGIICAVVVVAIFPFAASIRSAIASSLFPYITSLRFGYLGAFTTWAILDLITIGVTLYVMGTRGNLTMRSSGP